MSSPSLPLPASRPRDGRFALPLFMSEGKRIPIGVALWIVATCLYMLPNHFPALEPVQLPLWAIDRRIPFLPHLVWVYVSEYLFFIVIYLSVREMRNLSRFIYGFLSLQVFSVIIFWLLPTTYPRDLFPLPANLDPVTHAVFTLLRKADAPTNCCPSLHVSSVYLSALIFLHEQRKKLPFYLGWATAISLSTLATKQHYLVDVLAGMALALIFYWIFNHRIRYREIPRQLG